MPLFNKLFKNLNRKPEVKLSYPEHAVLDNIIPKLYSVVTYAIELGKSAEVRPDSMQRYREIFRFVEDVEKTIRDNGYSMRYANQFARDLEKLSSAFGTDYGYNTEDKRVFLQEEEKPVQKRQQEARDNEIETTFTKAERSFDFFSKLRFLNMDLVIIGANGAGKTTLAEKIKEHIENYGVVISAQRILLLPNLNNVKNATITTEELKEIQTADKRIRGGDIIQIQTEFTRVMQNLLSSDLMANRTYAEQARLRKLEGKSIEAPELTALQNTLTIWNDVFRSPILSINDGMNITAQKGKSEYPANQMSDGEKEILFLIAQVLQCPENGFVIVDEPEMHLHPTVHRMLWDRLEHERADGTFIYLTHDLEFATSRISAKKIWLREFTNPDMFRLQEIPDTKIPKPLLLELLGSRHDILFCEGTSGSYDTQLYTMLFPEFIVKPVEGCLSVIGYTKAYNTIPDKAVRAVGLIDSDYHSQERIESVAKEGIYAIRLAEIENLLLMEEVLVGMCHKFNKDISLVDNVKRDILTYLEEKKDKQVVEYVASRVNQYLTDTHVNKSDSLSGLDSNYQEYLMKIDMPGWAAKRTQQIEKIISDSDYESAIRIMNDKGLSTIVERILKIKNYKVTAIEFLKGEELLRQGLLVAFPINEIRRDG